MKKPLYYALARSYNSFYVVAVTTETARHWWGRGLDSGVGTHGRTNSLVGRFNTSSAAILKARGVDGIYAEYKEPIEAARQVEMQLLEARRRDIAKFLGVDTNLIH